SANTERRASSHFIPRRCRSRFTLPFPPRAFAKRSHSATASSFWLPSCLPPLGFCAEASNVNPPNSSAVLQKNFYFLARRFVAGENIGDAISAVRALNGQGM